MLHTFDVPANAMAAKVYRLSSESWKEGRTVGLGKSLTESARAGSA